MINADTINKLINMNTDDAELLDIIFDELKSFEEYHSAIYIMETKLSIFSYQNTEKEEYQSMLKSLDNQRTMLHNRILTAVNVLNRLAENSDLPLVYEGTVSKERPYRREVANAVLEYVEKVVKERR